jgi:acyl-CoA reductase-like NAD-dependent aldehyde dehydrogenase
MKELTHFIGDKHANGTSVRFCDGFEPMTGEVISRVPLASKAEVRAAVENAIAAQATISVDRRHDQIHPPLPISTERLMTSSCGGLPRHTF